ncbi:peptidoglycan D,D-transpeptidase FtsI family protein [Clostridium tarantellae]|uniref:Penicillin-binding protein 2 n=1 Tax=Clostridium tarantellae TaxID=39493 RepID=A0A6I1MGP0_9CLOT|nr:penicillin-binding transpeptidase domain-containing protein [Clostridium tarantellae]MPQ42696.1 penicillin-binding protein 2 [Clostridium tarantellae]
MKKTDLSSNIRKVMVVYLILLLGLITYITYFNLFKAPEIAQMPSNNRLWAKRNEVLRGTIYDRDGNALTSGERTGALTQTRQYLKGDLFSHILGYVNPKYGLTGLEKLYDSQLINYDSTSLKNFLKSFNFKKDFKNRESDDKKIGNSLVTTLSTKVQQVAYDALGNNKGAVVALNPKTGEILASVSKPTFNPNDLDNAMKAANSNADNHIMINRAVSGMYPPGSTFKVVTLSSALENITGIVDRTFNDTGKIDFGGNNKPLPNENGAAYGSISLKKALSVSSNVVFGTLAMELGNSNLKKTSEAYGFNLGIPSDGVIIDNSIFPTLPKAEKGNIARSGIGQSSILATPMQMALITSTIANNGVMMEPHLVNKVVNKDGDVVETIAPKEIKRVISKENASIIKNYMKGVVDDRINGRWTSFKGLNAAAKTGTAEWEKNGKLQTPHSWFIGFAPVDNPTVAVAVIVEEGGAGSGIASQIGAKVMRAALGK